MCERVAGRGRGRYQDIEFDNVHHSLLGLIEFANIDRNRLSFESVLSLIREGFTIQDFIDNNEQRLDSIRKPLKNAILDLLDTYGESRVNDMCSRWTFYHLIFLDMGVTESLSKLMAVAQIDFEEFDLMDYENFKSRTGGRNRLSTYLKLRDSYMTFKDEIGEEVFKGLTSQQVSIPVKPKLKPLNLSKREYKRLEKQFLETYYDEFQENFTVKELSARMDVDERFIQLILKNASRKGLLETDGYDVKKIRRSFEELLLWESLPEPEIIRLRLVEGYSVAEIADKLGLSRQGVSIKLKTALSLVPTSHVIEAKRYLRRFRKFKMNEDMFVKIFDEHPAVFRWLSLKVKNGNKDVREMYTRLTEEQQKRFEVYFSVTLLDGDLVSVDKKTILEKVIFDHAFDNSCRIEEIHEIYKGYIYAQFPVEIADSLYTDERTLQGIASRSSLTISSYGNRVRYHNPKVFTDERMNRLQILLQLEPGVYNARYIFQLDPGLMEELNCQDPSELHNIIKTRISHPHITMGRMPELAIGVSDKLTWVRHLIREHAPIPLEEFLDMLSRRFGLHIPSMRSLVQTTMLEHLSPDNVLIASFPTITDEETEWLRTILAEDIYTFDQLLDLHKDVPDLYDRFLNKWVLSHVGYTISGGFIVKSEYGSGEAYFRDVIKSKDLYRIQDIPAAKTQSYFKVLKDLETELEIFRADDDHYMNIGRLEKGGFSKSMIRAEIEDIVEAARHLDTEYFTFPMLQEVCDSELVDLGMENVFYERLIRIHPDVNFIPSGGGDIFYFSREKRMLGHFYLAHLHENEGIDVHVFERGLEERYGITFNSGKIIESIRDRGGFFSPETEKVYRDKSIFLDDLYRD